MSTVLIIGASRGIGRELARQYRAHGWRVLASARREPDLAELAAAGCEPLALDVTRVDDCAALAWKLEGERLDAAFLNAGVYGPRSATLEAPSATDFDAVMHTNVLAAMRLLPIVGPPVAQARGKLAVLSSRMGSISLRDNASGWLYRASKAALNSVLADCALSFGPQGATCVAFHPGWARTDMGGPDANIPVADSVAGMRALLAGLGPADNGKFFKYDGTALTW